MNTEAFLVAATPCALHYGLMEASGREEMNIPATCMKDFSL